MPPCTGLAAALAHARVLTPPPLPAFTRATGKKAKPHRAEAKFDSGDEVEAAPAPAPAVAADEDFVEANWDDDEDEAAAAARARAEEEARRKALRDPGVRPDEDFADANWDDDDDDDEDEDGAGAAALQPTRQRMDPGVTVDDVRASCCGLAPCVVCHRVCTGAQDFVDADWDEEDE